LSSMAALLAVVALLVVGEALEEVAEGLEVRGLAVLLLASPAVAALQVAVEVRMVVEHLVVAAAEEAADLVGRFLAEECTSLVEAVVPSSCPSLASLQQHLYPDRNHNRISSNLHTSENAYCLLQGT